MAKVSYTPTLSDEYTTLFNTCDISPARAREVDKCIDAILKNRARYEQVQSTTGVPWYVVAIIHNMEASQNFKRHLHNGDPLTARTVQVPAGRPKTGSPPFSWEDSARDALALRNLGPHTDWSLAGTLYQLEGYNGWGYRLFHPHVKTPYLWSFSNHYKSGKYIADGTWSDTAKSAQCGAAVLLRRMLERGDIAFPDAPPTPAGQPLLVPFSNKRHTDPDLARRAEELQRWLNTFPEIFVRVDGAPGTKTSDAFKRVTGRFLPGDPRAN